MSYKTEQEEFWAGEFGQGYMERNKIEALAGVRAAMFSHILGSTRDVGSVLELGCNIGPNLKALKQLKPDLDIHAYEINAEAAAKAAALNVATVNVGTILDPITDLQVDLSFTSGVLIHINPDALEHVYENLYRTSRRYILVIEYYNRSPVTINYRGHSERLFKRDFAGDLIDRYGLKLVDYRFHYHRDPVFPLDDCTWFLMEK